MNTTSLLTPVLPVARFLHTLSYLIISITVFASCIQWILVGCKGASCGSARTILVPFLIISGIGIFASLANMYRNITKTASMRWLLWESALGTVPWLALSIGAGLIAVPALTDDTRCAVVQNAGAPARVDMFSRCVFPSLLWVSCMAGTVNFMWGLGLWYLCTKEEKKREGRLSPV